jgi:hypothetical protein
LVIYEPVNWQVTYRSYQFEQRFGITIENTPEWLIELFELLQEAEHASTFLPPPPLARM